MKKTGEIQSTEIAEGAAVDTTPADLTVDSAETGVQPADAATEEVAAEPAKPSLYSLEEYRQIRKVKAGRIAGFIIWNEGDTAPKTIMDWDKSFDAFNSRKINK